MNIMAQPVQLFYGDDYAMLIQRVYFDIALMCKFDANMDSVHSRW